MMQVLIVTNWWYPPCFALMYGTYYWIPRLKIYMKQLKRWNWQKRTCAFYEDNNYCILFQSRFSAKLSIKKSLSHQHFHELVEDLSRIAINCFIDNFPSTELESAWMKITHVEYRYEKLLFYGFIIKKILFVIKLNVPFFPFCSFQCTYLNLFTDVK